jgi:hypothetical protein
MPIKIIGNNGYFTYDRKPKVPPEAVRAIYAEGLRARGPGRSLQPCGPRSGNRFSQLILDLNQP